MKIKALFVALVALLCSAGSSFAQGGASTVVIDKVEANLIRTPDIQYTGDPRRTPPNQNWLEMEVTFTNNEPQGDGYVDELTFKYYAKFGKVCLTGEVTHVNIEKSRDLHSVMYVSPKTLKRMFGGKTFVISNLDELGVQVFKQGQLLATKNLKSPQPVQWWQNLQQTPGLILNKSETPFAPLYWDRYEAIKAAK